MGTLMDMAVGRVEGVEELRWGTERAAAAEQGRQRVAPSLRFSSPLPSLCLPRFL